MYDVFFRKEKSSAEDRQEAVGSALGNISNTNLKLTHHTKGIKIVCTAAFFRTVPIKVILESIFHEKLCLLFLPHNFKPYMWFSD